MEITGFNSFCFTGNYREVVLSGVEGTVTLNLTDAGTDAVVLSEQYTPDADGIIRLRDIGKVLQSYILLPDIAFADSVRAATSINFVITNEEGTELFRGTQQVVYSRSYAQFDEGSQITDRFLTRYSRKYTKLSRKELVSFFANGQTLAYAVAYEGSSSIEAVEHSLGVLDTDMSIRTIDFSMSSVIDRLANECSINVLPNSVIYYDVLLYQGDVVIDRIRFVNDRRVALHEVSFAYYNLLGVPETVTFTGKEKTSQEFDGEYAYLSGKYRKYTTDAVEIREANSGWISKEALLSIRDMVSSPKLYTYADGVLQDEVVVTETDFSRTTPTNEALSVMITYRKADSIQDEFSRYDYDDMIFYDTFQPTFV